MEMRNKAVYASSEDAEQEAVVEYCDLRHIPIVHIPNEGKRSLSYAAKIKRMGLRRGFPDLFIPLARKCFHGLFIEMKYGKGKATKEQAEWISYLNSQGYRAVVCYGTDEALAEIDLYIYNKEDQNVTLY